MVDARKLVASQSQTELIVLGTQNAATQHVGKGKNYEKYRENKSNSMRTYDLLKEEILCNKDTLIGWFMDEKLIAKSKKCGHCNDMMKLVIANDRSDSFKWECRRQMNRKRHRVEISIGKDSWFKKATLQRLLS